MIKWLLLPILLLFINSCEKVTKYGNLNVKNCSIAEQNRYVYNFMEDRYFWYDQMPEVDFKSYSSPEALLKDLKYSLDKWSFIINKKALDDYYSGKGYIGHGFKMVTVNGKVTIEYVYKNSPADEKGMQRGDEILEINGKDVSGKSLAEISALLGAYKEGIENSLKLKKPNGDTYTITMQKKLIDIPSVLEYKVLNSNNKKVGYLLFDKFIETSKKELNDAFAYFKEQNIEELVIDLRYNGGGLVSMANHLSSLINENFSGDVFAKLIFNDKHRERDSTYIFSNPSNALALNDVYFLTTNNSASASEAVINGLKPYINVNIIGTKTHGKPVGMVGGEFCDKYIIPIEFEIVNSNNEGRYFNGINPTCNVADDFTHQLGDSNEKLLNEALYYITNGSCKDNQDSKMVISRKIDNSKNELQGLHSIIGAF